MKIYKVVFPLLSTIIIILFVNPQQVNASASFTISNTTPFLGDQLTITGSGLITNHQYYIYNDEAGVEKVYTDTNYQGKSAKQFTSSNTSFGTGTYYSYDLEDFDKILVMLNYYDAVVAAPFFNIGTSDIYWTNGGGAAGTIGVNSTGSTSWQTWAYSLNKEVGIPDFEWIFKKVGTNNVYISKINKYPMWTVTTDSNGSFTTTVTAPRTYSRNIDLDFNYKLFDPSDQSIQEISQITLSPNYNNFRTVKGLLTFHYIYNRPNNFNPNSGGVYANQIRKDIPNYRGVDWDVAFVGAILNELGYPDLRDEQARRLKDTIYHGTADLRCYPIGAGNYTDCTMAAWTTIKPAYERTGDTNLYNAMVDILNYSLVGYNATYNNFAQSSVASKEFWVDAGGGKPQFYYYMGTLLNNDTYKNNAVGMINTMIDKLQTSNGWFYQKYDFTTDSINGPVFWDGGQGWALNGLREFKDEVKSDPTQVSLTAKITTSLTKLADNLASRPISDLRSDERRSSIIAYNMLKLAQDTDYPQSKRDTWQKRGEELFILAMKTMNSEYNHLNTYGLTYSSSSNYTFSFGDYYMLKILNEIYSSDNFYQNNIGTQYTISNVYSGNSVYQALTANTNDWSSGVNPFVNTVTSTNNSLTGTVNPGDAIKLVKRDMTVSPSFGSVNVSITGWSTDDRSWSMSSSSEPSVAISFSDMSPNTTYNILKNNSVWKTVNTDSNGNISFTYDSGFSTHNFRIALPDSFGSVKNPNCIEGFVYCTQAGQHYQGTNNMVLSNSTTDSQDAKLIFSGNSTVNDVYVTINKVDPYILPENKIPLPWQHGFNTASDIFNFQPFYAFNGLSFPTFDNPVTIILKYDPSRLYGQNPQNLRIGFYDTTSKRWKTLPYNTIVNTSTNEIANVTRILSYFTVVYPRYIDKTTFIQPIVPTPLQVPTSSIKRHTQINQAATQKKVDNKHCIFFFCF